MENKENEIKEFWKKFFISEIDFDFREQDYYIFEGHYEKINLVIDIGWDNTPFLYTHIRDFEDKFGYKECLIHIDSEYLKLLFIKK